MVQVMNFPSKILESRRHWHSICRVKKGNDNPKYYIQEDVCQE
jgi:hypothetical protein